MIAEPPLETGALQLTMALAFEPVAVLMAGAPGGVGAGTTGLEALDGAPVPTELVAVTDSV